MFVGHYGASLALKAANRAIPLWLLFVAVQFVDVLWAVFVLLGVEKVRIVPGITATNPLDLYYMPYTHSLVGAVVWSVVLAVAYRLTARDKRWVVAALVAAAVFSHWVLDLIVHRPDLPLYADSMKVGLGLWNAPAIAFGLEIGLLFVGILLYHRWTRGLDAVGRYGMFVFGIVMIAIQASVFFGPPPESDGAIAVTALASYALFAWAAWFIERRRD